MVCDEDGRDIIEHAAADDCPLSRYVPENLPAKATVRQPTEQEKAETAARLALAGRAHWHELHAQAHPTPAWLADWRSRIPAFGCKCRAKFDELARRLPPDFSSPAAFHRRGWEWHDETNRELGKPRPAYAACAAQYGW